MGTDGSVLARDPGDWVRERIADFIEDSPLNSLQNGTGEPAWEEALVGFSSGADPMFVQAKEFVGEFHFTPAEIFGLTFPEERVAPEELTVISWVLPQREAVKADNRAQDKLPSERWIRARFPGEEFNAALRRHLVEALAEEGVQALAPMLSPHWSREVSEKFGFASRWSERHAAHIAGLGTFGLCDGLITPRGKAHRAGSVVARTVIEPTPRPYTNHRAYCLFFLDGSCRACAERCPVGAISEKGHDKTVCREFLRVEVKRHARETLGRDWYGCGLCQTGVPCESRIPAKALRALSA